MIDSVVVVGIEVDEGAGLMVVITVVVDGVVGDGIVDVVSGLTGVEINHRIKGKSTSIVVRVGATLRREPVFKEVKSWLRGWRSVE